MKREHLFIIDRFNHDSQYIEYYAQPINIWFSVALVGILFCLVTALTASALFFF